MYAYKITNLVNEKIYIGITTTSMGNRISSYKSATKSQKSNKHRVIMAMKKYGFENFSFEIVFETNNKEELKKKEIELIKFYNSTDTSIGYNVSPGGFLHSQESIKKKSDANKGKKLSKEHKEKISASLIGHRVTEKVTQNARAQVAKIAGWNRGTKGIMKSNSGSFSSDKPAPNKGRKKIIDQFGKIRYVKVA